MSSTYTPVEDTKTGKKLAGPVGWLDERLGLAALGKKNLRKVFPEHWSFMLGEIALWSFVVLLITGVFLTLWFDPSMAETVYTGSYRPLNGVEMSVAYASALDISFDVRGGLLLRQMHHWAAHLFIAAMMVHMLRVFFTGAYRKPREINWLIGLGLLTLGILAGFSGYSLPDDLLSGTGLRIADGMIKSIPLVGTHVSFFLFGGEFPGDQIIPRLYMAHILLIPALLLGLIAAHMLLLVYHKHTQFPGAGRTNENVVGYPMLPVYAAKAGGFFFIVFGVIAFLSATFTVNGIWIYGPYNPAEVTAGSQPDWYMGFAEGALRIFPPLEFDIFGSTWPLSVLIPGLGALGILFTLLGAWPFVERWITGDDREHHLLDRPRNAPTRTALGVAGMTAFGLLWIGGGNDVIALRFGLDLNSITYFLRVMFFLGPIIAFIVTRRICISLQRKDHEVLTHGFETGVIDRSPDGGYSERHAPLSVDKQYALTSAKPAPAALEAPELVDANGVDAPNGRKAKLRARLRRWYYAGAFDKPTVEEMQHAEEHLRDADQHPVDLGEDFQGVSETGVPRVH
ncbi:cytochrome bc complex cytochrome b subunit [Aeromicrobium sp. YIM 150415]|uniref:Cytochrome bc1 complex cytochrome b subunit n=1 Tax=Aeromicrobium piscarium TaxID=2590901 RepID=A0A554S9M8_9ACTN|nr:MULTISPECIES: cytochrome bc complex cytochrome b subunit [Aeromicrobium]MBM9464356.1 cytochrome bc complex cytochrome b subunit [Aeromicrobium sp. YIM 150415]TSD63050.1 cytochrome bc complex cytochrome b subunit [Aeromicrobium piscarium]